MRIPRATAIGNAEAWLFRIAHNASLEVLRQRTRQRMLASDEDIAMIAEEIGGVTGSTTPAVKAPASRAATRTGIALQRWRCMARHATWAR